MKNILLVFVFSLIAWSAVANAQEDVALEDILIHSDVPLWGSESEKVWPKSFVDDTSFGCVNKIKFGDWKYTEGGEVDSWFRLTNYGVFHCYLVVRKAYEQSNLKTKDAKHAYLIEIGQIKHSKKPLDLWILQLGARPGSDYILLTHDRSDGLVKSYSVLQRECPRKNIRSGPEMDILITRYCAVNSKRELIRIAKKMAKRPPLGQLVFVTDEVDDE
ncbi:MAG: hypothetical protein COA91_10765 [Robiginitomaculum sp.]|nr:MAG: hypothetical protein COA91_10765 [Robiginitomaculum sp.]